MPLAHHVGLVVETAGHCHLGDARDAEEQAAGVLEAKYPSGCLRRDAELAREALAEVSPAEAGAARELVNGHASMTDCQAPPRPCHRIGYHDRPQFAQEHSIHSRKTLQPGPGAVERSHELVA